MNSSIEYRDLVKIINDEIDKRNISYDVNGTVVSVSGSDVVVLLNGATSNITIKNYTGLTLTNGNGVIVHVMNGNLNNAFISHKKV